MRRTTFAALTLTLLLSFLLQGNAEAQIFKKKLKEENLELRNQIDSLQKVLDKLRKESLLKDSIADEMIGIYEENRFKTAAGLNPEDYTQEITDSLLSIWYLHRQAKKTRRETATTWIRSGSLPTFRTM